MWLSFLDEDGEKKEGFFEVINENENGFIVFYTTNNKVKIPLVRVLKIKQKIGAKKEGDN